MDEKTTHEEYLLAQVKLIVTQALQNLCQDLLKLDARITRLEQQLRELRKKE